MPAAYFSHLRGGGRVGVGVGGGLVRGADGQRNNDSEKYRKNC